MKKTFLSSIFLLALLIYPQTTRPSDIYKVMLPCGIVIAIAGGIATVYYYSKEKKLAKQLDILINDLRSLPEETAEKQDLINLIKTLKQEIARFNTARWFCGGITAAGIAATIISGILLCRQQRITQELEAVAQFHEETTAVMRRKTALGNKLRKKIITLKGKIKTTKLLEASLQKKKGTLKTLRKNHKKQKQCQKFIKKNKRQAKRRKKRLKNKLTKHQQTLEEIDQNIRKYLSIDTIAGCEESFVLFNKSIDEYLSKDKEEICEYLDQQK